MPTDKQNVEFLYSIIKQLEVKHINWSHIADTNAIPNGHAARMRFHRLKMAMEGTAPKPRPKTEPESNPPKTKTTQPANRKRKAKDSAGEKLRKKLAELEADEDDEEPLAELAAKRRRVKREDDDNDASGDEYVDVDERVKVKDEIKEEDGAVKGVPAAHEDEGYAGGAEDEGVKVEVKKEGVEQDDLVDEGLYDLPDPVIKLEEQVA